MHQMPFALLRRSVLTGLTVACLLLPAAGAIAHPADDEAPAEAARSR